MWYPNQDNVFHFKTVSKRQTGLQTMKIEKWEKGLIH